MFGEFGLVVVRKTFDSVRPGIALGVVESIRWDLDEVIGDDLCWFTMIDIFQKMQRMYNPKTWTSVFIFFF